MKNKKFPFSDAPNTACFTCCHVLEENKPILYVSHDEDGYWQFLCGGNHKEEDARVVSLASILSIDETMGDLVCQLALCERRNLFSKGFFDFANTRDMQVEHHNLYPLRYLSHLQW